MGKKNRDKKKQSKNETIYNTETKKNTLEGLKTDINLKDVKDNNWT